MTTTPIPVTIIGGYLGSGKTTLVNRLLRDSGVRLGVLVNEFGDLSIDEDLIESRAGGLVSLSGGCVCCSYGDDLLGGLDQLADSASPPEHILLEASGVALPASISASISLLSRFAVSSIIVLADVLTIESQSKDKYVGDTVRRQLSDADIIVLTKCDLAMPEQCVQSRNFLVESDSTPTIIESRCGDLPSDIVLGFAPTASARPHSSDNRHTSVFATRSYRALPSFPDVSTFAESLSACPHIFRVKGFVRDDHDTLYNMQLVGGRFELTEWISDTETGLVVIGLSDRLDDIDALMESHGLFFCLSIGSDAARSAAASMSGAENVPV